jgi:hypothetical protein
MQQDHSRSRRRGQLSTRSAATKLLTLESGDSDESAFDAQRTEITHGPEGTKASDSALDSQRDETTRSLETCEDERVQHSTLTTMKKPLTDWRVAKVNGSVLNSQRNNTFLDTGERERGLASQCNNKPTRVICEIK